MWFVTSNSLDAGRGLVRTSASNVYFLSQAMRVKKNKKINMNEVAAKASSRLLDILRAARSTVVVLDRASYQACKFIVVRAMS